MARNIQLELRGSQLSVALAAFRTERMPDMRKTGEEGRALEAVRQILQRGLSVYLQKKKNCHKSNIVDLLGY